MRASALVAASFALALFAAGTAAAQTRGVAASPGDGKQGTSGWSLTPTIVYAGSWDDNVLIHSEGDATAGDYLTVVNPRGTLEYNSARTQFAINYDGAFLLYRAFDTLDSYDQHGGLSLERLLTKRLRIFVRDSAALTPTTDAVEFVGVPFLRTGSRINDVRGGIDFALSKRTTMTLAYTTQWIGFDQSGAFAQLLHGGHSQGGAATMRHQVSSRATLVGNYDYQHAGVDAIDTSFDIQTTTAGLEYRLTDLTTVSVGVGISHLNLNALGPSRTGPAWHASLTRQFRRAGLDLSYSRSFVPSYGLGGTMENEEALGRARLPMTRRLYAQAALSWRRNEPLSIGELRLKSWWYSGGVGYSLTPWLRAEGFYNGAHQTIDRPGGLLNRNQIGFQLIVTQPMRIR